VADWNPRANELFLKAAEFAEPADRKAFLDHECRDADLRRQVESLLAASASAGSFLNKPAVGNGTAAYEPIPEAVGTVIGPYKLLQQIGEGGFGVVYMAEQEKPVRRMVALKIIKPGMDTAQVIARFESERQALALMDHPNIAKVLDAGATESGRPYFVMELVKGVPITEFCDKNHLPPEQRLKLFIDVCHAIQHAHHKGVIHRDVKPSNVMVTLHDGVPVVKVIDFGVAKATVQKLTERTLFTAYGQMIGTPAYMSPEQAEMSGLDIDTRSDVYSLGVLLYELLTGTTPLETKRLRQAGYAEMQRLIRDEEAPRPSTRMSSLGESATVLAGNRGTDPKQLVRMLAGDLDWIVMKALEKDRNRRYGTPGNFGDDIERYLRREAILARPPSAAYRLRKFAQRNRAAVAAASVVAAALLLGMAVAAWQAVRARRAEMEARAALAAAEHARTSEADQRRRAEVGEHKALAAAAAEKQSKETAQAREAEAKVVLDFLQKNIFAAARPKGLDGGLGYNVTLREALEAALPLIARQFRDQPLVEARLRTALALSYQYLGDGKSAAEQYASAHKLLSETLGPDHPDTLTNLNNVAVCYGARGRHAEAVNLYEETLALRKAKLGPTHPDTLESAINLARAYRILRRHAEAAKLLEETLDQYKAKLGPDHPSTLISMSHLADSYQQLGRQADALKLREEALARRRIRLGTNDPATIQSMNNLANSYSALGRQADALKLREEALALRRAKLVPGDPDIIWSMYDLADSYGALDRWADALKLCEQIVALEKSWLGPRHPDTIRSMGTLARNYYSLGRYSEALALQVETLALFKAELGPDHPYTLSCMNNLAASYAALGRHADALKLREETLALRRAKLGPDHPETLWTMRGLAESLVVLDRGAEAVAIIDDCLKRGAAGTPDAKLVTGLFGLRLRHFEKAKDAGDCRESAEKWETLNRTDADSLYNAACWRGITAAVFAEAGKADESKADADRAMDWLRKATAAGYKNSAHIKKDKDLDALRDREDFKKLLSELEAKTAAQK
jgi:non-specific serine/threonine protein kinase/serine/threonine-protein kinase